MTIQPGVFTPISTNVGLPGPIIGGQVGLPGPVVATPQSNGSPVSQTGTPGGGTGKIWLPVFRFGKNDSDITDGRTLIAARGSDPQISGPSSSASGGSAEDPQTWLTNWINGNATGPAPAPLGLPQIGNPAVTQTGSPG